MQVTNEVWISNQNQLNYNFCVKVSKLGDALGWTGMNSWNEQFPSAADSVAFISLTFF